MSKAIKITAAVVISITGMALIGNAIGPAKTAVAAPVVKVTPAPTAKVMTPAQKQADDLSGISIGMTAQMKISICTAWALSKTTAEVGMVKVEKQTKFAAIADEDMTNKLAAIWLGSNC